VTPRRELLGGKEILLHHGMVQMYYSSGKHDYQDGTEFFIPFSGIVAQKDTFINDGRIRKIYGSLYHQHQEYVDYKVCVISVMFPVLWSS
jgi:hypothetical protein